MPVIAGDIPDHGIPSIGAAFGAVKPLPDGFAIHVFAALLQHVETAALGKRGHVVGGEGGISEDCFVLVSFLRSEWIVDDVDEFAIEGLAINIDAAGVLGVTSPLRPEGALVSPPGQEQSGGGKKQTDGGATQA